MKNLLMRGLALMAVLAALLAPGSRAQAQDSRGVIAGTVADSAGGLLP